MQNEMTDVSHLTATEGGKMREQGNEVEQGYELDVTYLNACWIIQLRHHW